MLKYLNLFIKGCDSKMIDKELRNIASRYSPNLYSCKHTLQLHTKYDSDASIRRYSFFTKNRDDELTINYDIIQPETNFQQIRSSYKWSRINCSVAEHMLRNQNFSVFKPYEELILN